MAWRLISVSPSRRLAPDSSTFTLRSLHVPVLPPAVREQVMKGIYRGEIRSEDSQEVEVGTYMDG